MITIKLRFEKQINAIIMWVLRQMMSWVMRLTRKAAPAPATVSA